MVTCYWGGWIIWLLPAGVEGNVLPAGKVGFMVTCYWGRVDHLVTPRWGRGLCSSRWEGRFHGYLLLGGRVDHLVTLC